MESIVREFQCIKWQIFLLLLFLYPGFLYCQDKQISGIILNEDLSACKHVNIYDKKNAFLGTTDTSGSFSVIVSDTLSFSAVGMNKFCVYLKPGCNRLELIMLSTMMVSFNVIGEDSSFESKRIRKTKKIRRKAIRKHIFQHEMLCYMVDYQPK